MCFFIHAFQGSDFCSYRVRNKSSFSVYFLPPNKKMKAGFLLLFSPKRKNRRKQMRKSPFHFSLLFLLKRKESRKEEGKFLPRHFLNFFHFHEKKKRRKGECLFSHFFPFFFSEMGEKKRRKSPFIF